MFRIVPTLLFIAMLWPATLWAQSGSAAYTVRDVKVDIVAESSVKARNQAFAAAEVQAFKMLSERFLAPDQLAGFTQPSLDIVAGMVADFEITSEQLSKRRYLGTYVFRFKEGPVNRFFGHAPIAGTATDSGSGNRLLIIPVFSQNGATSLWDIKKNPWLEAWQKQAPADIPNLIVPAGDVSDTMDIRETQPDKFSQSGLKRFKARYGANDMVILFAVFDQSSKDMLKINLYRTDRGKVELTQTLPIQVGKATKLGELLASAVPQAEALLTGNWRGQALPQDLSGAGASAPPPVAVAQVPAQAIPPSPYTPQAGQIKATAQFNTMGDWLAMRRSLNGIPPLQSIRILVLTTNQASMEFTYSDWMALTSALSARGLTLRASVPGEYNLVKTANPTGYMP